MEDCLAALFRVFRLPERSKQLAAVGKIHISSQSLEGIVE
jgi:hypothetical protein